jgi:ATP-dependent phosphofructokinase / diphosphate-dependent phosphofructokinase
LRIGILTGGGDCPGLNAVIRGIVRRGVGLGQVSFVGFRHGWAGVLEQDTLELTRESTAGILPRGGTILGTSRTNPFDGRMGGLERIKQTFERERLDVLIPIGGEDTLGVALRLSEAGLRLVGVPKTIDNDIGATDFTFGFQTAVQIATDAIDRLHTTAESHNRVMVVEVMGRHAGWIATYAGIAGGADAILVPERPFDIEEVCARLRRRHARGVTFSIVVVSEGASPREGTAMTLMTDRRSMGSPIGQQPTDEFGHARLGGIGVELAHEIESATGYETRATILGHVQRGGTPTAYDRVLATRFGVAAMDAAAAGRFGQMVALQGAQIVEVGLAQALAEPKLLDPALFETAEVFFG